MSRNNLFSVFFIVLAFVLTSCEPNDDTNSVVWGKTRTYDPFLWKKQVPDTLNQTLCFDFNDDARRYLRSPLQLGIYKKDTDGHLKRLSEDEVQLFVNHRPLKDNILTVNPTEEQIEVGMVLGRNAEEKMHYWYLKPVSTGGLDRINDLDTFGTDDAVMEIKVQKKHVMNPLAKVCMWIGFLLAAALVLWFCMLKYMFFPTFRVARLQLKDPEPYLSQLKLKGYRLCILSAEPKKQSWLNRLFTGEIKYEVNPLWTAQVVFEPRDRKSVRVCPDKLTYTTTARILKCNEDHVIVNETTNTKTTMTIS